jgi:alpha-1,3-rhamnosyl/mannosyltransferase|tara:strand:- start:18 stop:1130 length:1113 start_codon:yes stop_codon:yes gene_type:complete
MKVGLGTTVLSKRKASGHLDGIGFYTKHLLEHLPSTGIEVTHFGFNEKELDTNVISLGKFSSQTIMSTLTGLSFYSSRRVEKKVRLFHATDHRIPKLANTPVVATIMDPIPLVHPEWVSGKYRGLKNVLFKRMGQWADHVITISEYSAAEIEEHLAIPRANISVIPLGVDKQCFDRVSEQKKNEVLSRYNLTPEYFVCIGTLQPRKNVVRLLDAFLQLSHELQCKHPLVIIGRNGWDSDFLIERLNKLKGSRRVFWLDYVSSTDKYALLQSSLAMVFPSLYEGFGLPILEAFASDIPVITSNITSLPEVAAEAAILVDPYSIDDITQAMLNIATDKALHSKLCILGQHRVKRFSWQTTAEETANIYRSML